MDTYKTFIKSKRIKYNDYEATTNYPLSIQVELYKLN